MLQRRNEIMLRPKYSRIDRRYTGANQRNEPLPHRYCFETAPTARHVEIIAGYRSILRWKNATRILVQNPNNNMSLLGNAWTSLITVYTVLCEEFHIYCSQRPFHCQAKPNHNSTVMEYMCFSFAIVLTK